MKVCLLLFVKEYAIKFLQQNGVLYKFTVLGNPVITSSTSQTQRKHKGHFTLTSLTSVSPIKNVKCHILTEQTAVLNCFTFSQDS